MDTSDGKLSRRRTFKILSLVTLCVLGVGTVLIATGRDPYAALRGLHPRESVHVWYSKGKAGVVRTFFFTQPAEEVNRAVANLAAQGATDGVTLIPSLATPGAPHPPLPSSKYGFIRTQGVGGERTIFTVSENDLPLITGAWIDLKRRLGIP